MWWTRRPQYLTPQSKQLLSAYSKFKRAEDHLRQLDIEETTIHRYQKACDKYSKALDVLFDATLKYIEEEKP